MEDYESCNTQSCPLGSRDFRDLQCSFFNGQKYMGRQRSWRPFRAGPLMTARDPCSLFCAPIGLVGNIVKFSSRVVDGTRCANDSNGVCIEGKCFPIGCDNHLNSNTTYDWCGVCGGTNSTCYRVSDVITRDISSGYTDLLIIPRYARHIRVTERAESEATLALKNNSGIVFINGVGHSRRSTVTKLIAGSLFYYRHGGSEDGLESLHAQGPTSHSLTLMGFTRKRQIHANFWYEYTVSTRLNGRLLNNDAELTGSNLEPEDSYPWQTLLYNYMLSKNGFVGPKSSIAQRKNIAPTIAIKEIGNNITAKVVNKLEPPSATEVSSTANCTTTDRDVDSDATNYRHKTHSVKLSVNVRRTFHNSTVNSSVESYDAIDDMTERNTLGNALCDEMGVVRERGNASHDKMGVVVEEDGPVFMPNPEYPKFDHHHEEDTGALHVDVLVKLKKPVPRQKSDHPVRRVSVRTNEEKKDYEWKTNSITPCSSTCSAGSEVRFFSCFLSKNNEKVEDEYCDLSTRPDPSYHICTRRPCQARWVAGMWSQCSRTCGVGQQFRTVRCWRMMAPGFDSTVHDYLCDSEAKPQTLRQCNESPCGPQWEMSLWGECFSACGHSFKNRLVRCNAGREDVCYASQKPDEQTTCSQLPCTNQWHTSEWSRCSGDCSVGLVQRRVTCWDMRGHVVDDRHCDRNTKPLTTHACGDKYHCRYRWVPQLWDRCPIACGTGEVTRKVICGAVINRYFKIQPDSYCHRVNRPVTSARCQEHPCGPKWFTTEWSKCSQTCGPNAVRMREVKCYYGKTLSEGCDDDLKPDAMEKCALPDCLIKKNTGCDGDTLVSCDLVIAANLCSHYYYRKMCCYTCKTDLEQNRNSRYPT